MQVERVATLLLVLLLATHAFAAKAAKAFKRGQFEWEVPQADCATTSQETCPTNLPVGACCINKVCQGIYNQGDDFGCESDWDVACCPEPPARRSASKDAKILTRGKFEWEVPQADCAVTSPDVGQETCPTNLPAPACCINKVCQGIYNDNNELCDAANGWVGACCPEPPKKSG